VVFKQVLGYHCLLVDVMDICQVAAKGTPFHPFPALITLHVTQSLTSGCPALGFHAVIVVTMEITFMDMGDKY
jgi:hypothetical protein